MTPSRIEGASGVCASNRLSGLSFEEWLALKFWLAGAKAIYAIRRIKPADLPEEYEPHHYMAVLKTRAVAIARAHERHDLLGLLRDPQPVSEASVKRIRDALDVLEKLPLHVTPKPSDPISKWLSARVANPLERAGLSTVAELYQATIDPNWHRHIEGLGRAGRSACNSFLRVVRTSDELVPIDLPTNRLQRAWQALAAGKAPAELDGRAGRFRGPADQCALDAHDDLGAIEAWLNAHDNEVTRESYRKELRRVMLWAATVRGRSFSDLTVEDAAEYRDFLTDPQPAANWIGPRRPLEAPDWRPFARALGLSSQRYSLQVVRACARWLNEQNYLVVNPWAGIQARALQDEPFVLDKVPTRSHWALVSRLADSLETHGWDAAAAVRCRFVLSFLRGTGLRVSELATLRLRHIYEAEAGEWFIRVTGKGGKVADIDLLPGAKQALEKYLLARDLSALIETNDPELPVVSGLASPYQSLNRKGIWRIIDRFRRLAVVEFSSVNKRLAKQLEQLSPHTMRHLCGSHALAAGAQLKDVQDALRHANIRTTSTYIHSDSRQRRRRLAKALE